MSDLNIKIEQSDVDAVLRRGGGDVFDIWWTALGLVVRLKALSKRKELPSQAAAQRRESAGGA